MNFDYIFVLTYGRSGSTLLQGILNSIEGVEIRGENGASLRGLFASVGQLRFVKSQFGELSDGPHTPWYGLNQVDIEGYTAALRNAFISHVLKPSANVRVTGFKEIRYMKPLGSLEHEIQMFRQFFPKSAFIINTRNLDATIRSTAKSRHNASADDLRRTDADLRALAERGHPDVFHVHYDDYKDEIRALQPLFAFLGADFDEKRLAGIVNTVHSTKSD